MFSKLNKPKGKSKDRPSAAKALPDAIVEHALGKPLVAQLGNSDAPRLALIVKVPADSWCGLIEAALDRRFKLSVMTSTMQRGRRSGYNKKDDGEELLKALGSGLSTIAISASPDEVIAPEYHAVIDRVIEIERLDVGMVRRAIRKVTGEYARGLKQQHLIGVGPHEAMAVIGSGESASDCVARLRRIRERKLVPIDLSHVPALDKLPLTAPVRAWVDGLTADISRLDTGRIAPSGLRYAVLEGPPGTGKTLLASAIGKSTGWRFVKTSVQDWFNSGDGHLGAVTKAATRFIDDLLSEERCIGFIDELQSIPNRETLSMQGRDWWMPVVDGVLMQIDRARQSGKKILLIGACNHYKLLDSALVRPGRLERRISVLPPSSVEEVSDVLCFYLGGKLNREEITNIANLALGCSPASIEAAVRQAEAIARNAGRQLKAGDLIAVLAPDNDRDIGQTYRVALHEAGHALIAHRLGIPVISVSIIASGNSGGSTMTGGMSSTPSASDVEAAVLVALAGRATDEILGGGIHAGASGDLATATALLVEARNSWGLFGKLVSTGQLPVAAVGADQRMLGDWIETQLARLMDRAREMVARDQTAIHLLAAALVERKALHGAAIVDVIEQAGEPERPPSITLLDGPASRPVPDPDKMSRIA